MTRSKGLRALICLAVLVAAGAPVSQAARGQHAQRFSQGELFFELNDTDGDLGIHSSIDGGPWTDLVVEGPDVTVRVGGNETGRTGTEIVSEDSDDDQYVAGGWG